MKTLRAENIVKEYKGRKVVKGISLEVKQGEIIGLLGPNGAGKTTSFYMIVGFIKPNAGHIFLNDKEITRYPMYKRAQNGIGYLAQEPSVFRKMSIEDNILSVLQLTKLSKKEQLYKMESLIDEFNLGHIRKNRGDLLSGGERRRTEIARALATSPDFILLDEPFAGVDPIAVEDIQNIVFQLKKEVPQSVVVILSDAGEKPMLTVGVSADIEDKYHAGNIVKDLAKEIQGGGGGNPGFATAGGKNLDGLANAEKKALEL